MHYIILISKYFQCLLKVRVRSFSQKQQQRSVQSSSTHHRYLPHLKVKSNFDKDIDIDIENKDNLKGQ